MLNSISAIVEAAKKNNTKTVAVAAAHDYDVILSVAKARAEKIADAVLVGNKERIVEILTDIGENPADFEIIHSDSDEESAKIAVSCVNQAKAGFLMKGLLPTSTLMKAVLDAETGLRGDGLISHVMLYETGEKMLGLTDGGMNTFPDLSKKMDILENAARLFQSLGYEHINAACICGAEDVNPKIQSTVDADELSKNEKWAKYNMTVFGPVGLDLAISESACEHKKYNKPGAGKADILLVPTYEVGNGIGKALTYFANAKSAGVIVGAKVPVVLVSRSDTAETKLASIALASVVSG